MQFLLLNFLKCKKINLQKYTSLSLCFNLVSIFEIKNINFSLSIPQ